MAYKVIGNRIYHNGNKIQIYGVNCIGMETQDAIIGGLWTDLTISEWVSQIKDMGFNTLRLPIGTRVLQNVEVPQGTAGIWPGSKNEKILKGKKSLDILDMLVAELEKQNMRYIFDMHYLENGKILDLWYSDAYPEKQWLADMDFVAKRFRGFPGFIGIDTKNEPNSASTTWGDGNPKTDWKLASEKSYKTISAANPDILTIVEWTGTTTGLKEMTDKPLDIPLEKLVLSVHLYGSDVWQDWGEGFKDPSFPSNMEPIWEKQWGFAARKQAVFIGEFGGHFGTVNPKDKDWQVALVDYMRKNMFLDFTYWGLGDNSGGECGGIYADGGYRSVREDKLANLERIQSEWASYTDETAKAPITSPVVADNDIDITKPLSQIDVGDTLVTYIGGKEILLTAIAQDEEGKIECVYLKDGEIMFCVLPKTLLRKI